MTLADILQTGQKINVLESLGRELQVDPYNPMYLDVFLQYVDNSGTPLHPTARRDMENELGRDPTKFRRLLNRANYRETNRLVDYVNAEGYEAVVNATADEHLRGVALNIPDEDKDFYKIIRKLRSNDIGGARRAYADTFENDVWKDFISSVNDEFIKRKAREYVEIQKLEFLKQYTVEREEDGRTVRELDYNTLKDYIKNTVKDYTEEDDKRTAYVVIGKGYVGTDVEFERDELFREMYKEVA